MESRWLYRGLEEAVSTGAFCRDEYPHTEVSRSVRYSFREKRDLHALLMAKYVAVSARSSHEKYDPASAAKSCLEVFNLAVSEIPYMSPDNGAAETDRERAVELFNEVADEMERIVSRLKNGKVDIESSKVV